MLFNALNGKEYREMRVTWRELFPFFTMLNKVFSSSLFVWSLFWSFLGRPLLLGAGLGVGFCVSSGLDITLLAPNWGVLGGMLRLSALLAVEKAKQESMIELIVYAKNSNYLCFEYYELNETFEEQEHCLQLKHKDSETGLLDTHYHHN